jgi:hypothetical protein
MLGSMQPETAGALPITERSRSRFVLRTVCVLVVLTLLLSACWRRTPVEPHVAHVSNTAFTVVPGGAVVVGIILDGMTGGPLTVRLNVSGATEHFDVTPSPASIQVGAGQSSAHATVTAKPSAPPGASLTVAITPGDHYVVGTPASATVSVAAP